MDTNLRIRADALGMRRETYENQRVEVEQLDTGVDRDRRRRRDDVDASSRTAQLAPRRAVATLDPERVRAAPRSPTPSHTALGRYDADEAARSSRFASPREGVMGIRPRNKEQTFALDLLLDDSIRLVTLVGKAGTGKTLLALAAGLKRTVEDAAYTRMLVSRARSCRSAATSASCPATSTRS